MLSCRKQRALGGRCMLASRCAQPCGARVVRRGGGVSAEAVKLPFLKRTLVVALVVCLALCARAAAAAPVEPYGANDAGGFRNVLPAGENGLVNAKQLS